MKATTSTDQDLVIEIKVVPGASRDEIVGLLGDALKIRVSAPPEGGKANKAVCDLLAAAVGVAHSDVQIIAGHTQPRKRVRIAGLTAEQVRNRLRGR